MTIYICDNCTKEFIVKRNYNRHLNKKHPCKNINNKIYDFKCEYCLIFFTQKHSLLKHINKSCKIKKELNVNLFKLKELQLKEKELQLKEKELNNNKELKEKELVLKEKELVLKEKELNYKIQKKHNTINSNNINITNNNITIQVVAFGTEDLNQIPDCEIKSFIGRGFMSIHQMVEYLNFNKDIPENQNVYVSNKRDNTIMIFNGEKWIVQEKDDTLDTILNKKGDFLEKKYEEFYGELSVMSIAKFKQFKKNRHESEQMSFMKNRLNKLMYNNRDLPLNKLIKKSM